MCMYTIQKQAVVTTKDLVCYKVVYHFEEPFALASEVYNFQYELGREYTAERFDVTPKSTVLGYDTDFNLMSSVNHGFHSYMKYRDAVCFRYNDRRVVMKCIIPKGSLVFLGTNGTDCYCSNKIRVIGYQHRGQRGWTTKN